MKYQTRKQKREQLTTKMRKSTMFRYRLIITMPPWAVLIIGAAITIGMVAEPMVLTNIVSVAAAAISVVLAFVARRTVKALRFDVHEALNNIGNDDLELADYEAPPETIRLKKMDHTNGHKSSRVSE